MRCRSLALIVLAACANDDPGSPRGPSLIVHVINHFEGCTSASLTANFPPNGTSVVQSVDCRTFASGDADFVVSYPSGTTAGQGTVSFRGEKGAPGEDVGTAEFTVVDPGVSATVALSVCHFPGFDGGPDPCHP